MFRLSFILLCFRPLIFFIIFGIILSAESPELNSDILMHIKWREIGPASFGGRIDDIEAVADNPNIIFIGTASGGIFKSVNNGVTWEPVFDEEGTAFSIGDIAIAPSDSNIIWAGTGEPNNRQSSSWGNGVYKSVDGGEVWKHIGLNETHHIGRIVIHPKNPNIVYVAALGHLWGPNPERGLYRTKDGGKTWENVLFINEDTGIVDIAIEGNGRILYAAAYQRRRRACGFVGGGPYSGLYRSLDGGDTWEELSRRLPEGDTGRIGIDISKSHPNIVYAIIENKHGGVFKSEDRGKSWVRMNKLNPRPMYYSQIRIDPLNPHKVWVLGTELHVSLDDGKTFTSKGTGNRIHVDHHSLWINPNNPDHLLLGGDGGFYISYDGSKTWDFLDNLPIAQYYAIGIDSRYPYWIYGGTQDNGTWGIPSRTYSKLGILNSDVVNIAHGDGYYVAVDPKDHTAIYAEAHNGRLYLINLETREEKSIRPVPEDPEEEYRRNWSCPMILSPHDSDILYYGRNKLLKTTDRGHSWKEISSDLTRNQNWKKIPIMGMERNRDTLSRDDGVGFYGTITTISESPFKAGLIYIGTDDGKVQMTLDGGHSWKDLTKNIHLQGSRWVSRVLCSHHSIGKAYVSFDGHQDNDFTPYIFKTMDFGKTWKSISEDIPEGMVVNVVAEHPRNPNLLFAGTEFGLFLSINGGKNWTLAKGNLLRVPVDDIIVNARDNDLILGTHGRGIIILDDIAMLENLYEKVLESDVHLFPLRETIQYYETRELPIPGASKFSGPNPDYGALITYYIKNNPSSGDEKSRNKCKVKIIILDNKGNVVRMLDGPDRKGLNRISWDLRFPLPSDYREEYPIWFAPYKGPFVLPGEYTVKLIAHNQERMQKVMIRINPHTKTAPENLQARFAASMTVLELLRAFKEGEKAVDEMDKKIMHIKHKIKNQEDLSKAIKARIENITKKLEEIKKSFKSGWPEIRFLELLGQLQASTSAPTQAQMRTIKHLISKWEKNIEKVNDLLSKEFPELQSQFYRKDVPVLISKPIKPLKRKKVH